MSTGSVGIFRLVRKPETGIYQAAAYPVLPGESLPCGPTCLDWVESVLEVQIEPNFRNNRIYCVIAGGEP